MPYTFNPFTGTFDYYRGASSSSSSWKDPVANVAALPAVGNSDGDARITLDTDTIYIWNAGSSTWIPVPGYQVDKYTLNNTDISNKAVILSKVPTNASKVNVDIPGGTLQVYSVDYTIDSALSANKTLDWNGLGLDGLLASGDILVVTYS